MIRLLLSIIILAAVITYALLPLMKQIRKGLKRGGEKIEETFNDNPENKEDKKY